MGMGIAVKICGLTTAGAVDAAVRGGAAMTGFVFFPASPRSLDLVTAAALVTSVPERVLKVGVLVNPDDDLLARTLEVVPLDMLQLHGAETPDRVAEIRARTGRMVMKALRIGQRADLDAVADFASVADYLLFDAKPPQGADFPGGHGRVFDWRILRGLSVPCPWLLAGGIDDSNLESAVRLTGAQAVDVSSGVEVRPGLKDVCRIEALLKRAAALPSTAPSLEVPA